MREKKDFLRSDEEINKYFNNYLPVRFDKFQDEYNISILEYDFNNRVFDNVDSNHINGVIFMQNGFITLYYDNNKDIKEQRVIIANLIGYLEIVKLNKKEDEFRKKYYVNLTDEDIFNNTKPYNKTAREILLPKESLEKLFLLLKSIYKEEYVIYMLSNKFVVPEKEIIIGINDLGYELNIDLENIKTKKLI